MGLIGSVVVTPTNPKRGESVKFEVLDLQGQSLDGRNDVKVTLNGVPGALQWLQFATAGDHAVIAQAVSGTTRERKTVKLTVSEDELKFKPTAARMEAAQLPLLRLNQSQTNPYVATFAVGNSFSVGSLDLTKERRKRARRTTTPLRTRVLTAAERVDIRRRMRAAIPISPLEKGLTDLANARDALPGGTRIRTTSNRKVDVKVFDIRDTALDELFDKLRKSMKARYEWTFGDGTTAVTTVPYVDHDFFHHMQHAAGPVRFHVSCKIMHEAIEVKRTLNLISAYALCKQRGTIVPHVTSDIYAHKSFLWFSASMTVYNVEDVPITLDKQAIEPLSDSPTAHSTPVNFVKLTTPITLPPKSSTALTVNTPIAGAVPKDAPGFTVYFAGTAQGGMPVRITQIFEVPLGERDQDAKPNWGGVLVVKTWPWDEVTRAVYDVIRNPGPEEIAPAKVQIDDATGTIATTWIGVRDIAKLRGARMIHDRVRASTLAPVYKRNLSLEAPIRTHLLSPALAARGMFRAEDMARHPGSTILRPLEGPPTPPPVPPGPPAPGAIKEGDICDPDNLTEADLVAADQQQLACQLTGDIEQVMMPGRFMNARKGDIILSPGGTGLIGTLLRNVEPSQNYSHSGLMTRNYDEVTHSTASESYIDEYIAEEEPTDGLPENMIKYMWPGVVTQPVEAAVNGEPYTHPENGKQYSISSFSSHAVGITHNNEFMMVPPLVVKPDPIEETDEVRTKLHAVADWARSQGYRPGGTPKSHYRLYCYTDPAIGQTTTAPTAAGWAAGTFPSVCSALCWMANKAIGTRLETDQTTVMPNDLEPKDVAAGAFVNPGTPDGLYTYTAAERLAAAQWLYDKIYYMGNDAAGWLVEALTDAADDMANQLCNTFANDDAKGQDNENWKNQKDANAVSPDNIQWWDGPSKGGLYGYSEPLIYREPRLEAYPVSKWVKVLTRGNLSGTIKWKGSPIDGADVRVYEGKSTKSLGDGSYSLHDVGFGTYNLLAWRVIDGKYCSASKVITVDKEDMTVDAELQPPAEDFRLARVYFDFWGQDDDVWDEQTDPGAERVNLELGPDRLTNSFTCQYKWGGELRCEYKFTLRLLVGNVIDLQVDCKLYEGTDESTDDLDGWGSLSLQAHMGEITAGSLRVWNTAEDYVDDQGVLTVMLENEQNNN